MLIFSKKLITRWRKTCLRVRVLFETKFANNTSSLLKLIMRVIWKYLSARNTSNSYVLSDRLWANILHDVIEGRVKTIWREHESISHVQYLQFKNRERNSNSTENCVNHRTKTQFSLWCHQTLCCHNHVFPNRFSMSHALRCDARTHHLNC